MTLTAGLRPRRQQRLGGSDRDFGYDAQNTWPVPSYIPQTAPGVAVLDDFNTGATQLLTARPGWSSVGTVVLGDTSWQTDATPTVATTAVTPANPHSNIWNSPFDANQEIGAVLGNTPGATTITLHLHGDAAVAGGLTLYYGLFVNCFSGVMQILRSGNLWAGPTTQPAPVTGDSYALQTEGAYIFAWRKPAAGVWTLILAARDVSLVSNGRFIGFSQAAGGTGTVDQIWGGSLTIPTGNPAHVVRRAWAGR